MSSGDLFRVNRVRESTVSDLGEPSDDDELRFISQESVICQDRISIFLSKDQEYTESTVLSSSRSSHNELLSEVSRESASKKISSKRSVGEGTEEDSDGFQTPTKLLHYSSSNGITCPPAPKKPKSEPLRNRKRRNLQLDFVNEVESVLTLLTDGVRKMKKARKASNFGATMNKVE